MLSSKQIGFGVHSFTAYNTKTRIPYGTVEIMQSANFNLSGEIIQQNGGSNRYAWDAQDGLITAELELEFGEVPNWLTEIFLGKATTVNAAEAGASVTTIANQSGISTIDAVTGIASVAVATPADVPFDAYTVVAASATTVDVYGSSNVDYARGADKSFTDDTLLIASGLTITMAGTTAISNFGIEFTGGSGAIAMVTGDTATFSSRPENTGSSDVVIGSNTDVFPEFGALIQGQQKSDGDMFELDVFRCKAIGLPVPFTAKEFSNPSLTATAFFDQERNGVFTMERVTPTNC